MIVSVNILQWDHPNVVMVIYDVTSETSFSSCAKWLERVRSQKPDVHLPGKLHILIYFFHACHLF